MIRLLLLSTAAIAFAAGFNVTGYARSGWIAGPQPRAYELAAGRDAQEDDSAAGQPGASGKASAGNNLNDDQDDRPRVKKYIEDRPLMDRIQRDDGYRSRDRDDDRLRGRNYRD